VKTISTITEAKKAKKAKKAPLKTISTIAQAKKAPPGLYGVEDAEGLVLNKRGKAYGAGGFNFRFTLGGERLLMSFGSPNDFDDLDEVRDAATAARKLVKEGINPAYERERRKTANLAVKQPVTFKQKAEAVRDVYTPTLKHKYAAGNWFNPIKRHAFPIIGDMSINDVEPRHIAAVLAAVDVAAPKSSHRLRAHVAMIFNAAIANGDRDALRGNPADARLMRAMRPGNSKSDDENYRRIELNDAPKKLRALQAARRPLTALLWRRRWMPGCSWSAALRGLVRRSKCNGRRSTSKRSW
jgi:hypothetical protein